MCLWVGKLNIVKMVSKLKVQWNALPRSCLRQALGCMHFPGLSHSGSSFWVLPKGTELGLRFMPFPGPSSSGDQVLGEHSQPQVRGMSYRLPPVPVTRFSGCTRGAASQVCRVSLLGSWPLAATLPTMSTIQNLKNSWLATEPVCSLVEDASLGPGLPLSGSGCSPPPPRPRLRVSSGGWAGPQPVSSPLLLALSLVLRAGLAVPQVRAFLRILLSLPLSFFFLSLSG